jgi:hypothetical protein
MHSTRLPRPLRLSRAWPLQLADRWADAARPLLAAVRGAWHRAAQRRAERRELDAASELSDTMLRDMGAPDWLQAQAEARRAARRFDRETSLLGGPRGSVPHY